MKLPIIVIGGGPAGSICALELARLGHRVTLAERTTSPTPKLGETCGPRVRQLLKMAGGLSLPESIYRPLEIFFSAWGSPEIDGRSFTFWQGETGLVLDRTAFDKWLLDSAESAGVTVLRGCKVIGGTWAQGSWKIEGLVDGRHQTLNASFIVEATGPRVRSAVQQDVKRVFTDTLVCLSVELPAQSSESPSVMVESCEVGWWYTVKLLHGRQIVALFTDVDLLAPAETRLEWLNSLLNETTHIRRLVNEFTKDAKVEVCDARTSIRNVLWRAGWISIGDAVWSLDPLSGFGIQRAINDGINAAPAISRALTGDAAELRAYAVSQGGSFNESLRAQRRYYSAEMRWEDAAFWRRRQRYSHQASSV
ncbi:MAG: NAD(P)/FAD-dependent oxidoreductase [Pyrinomonadaceae bacterium]